MDILQYSAIKEQTDLCNCVAAAPGILSTLGGCLASYDSGRWYHFGHLANMFVCPAIWYCAIPCAPPTVSTVPGASNSLCIVDTTGTFRQCNAGCTWTVPAGASFARIQLWGSGAGTNSGCCCGGSPFGTTGAYASTIIPVQPGWTYALCAGCAVCCFDARAGSNLSGAFSYADGCGLCNFCADGGCSSLWMWMSCANCNCYGYRMTSFSCNNGGSCICNSCFDYCFSSCSTCGKIPFLYGQRSYYGCIAGGTLAASFGSVVAGIRSIYRSYISDSTHNVCQVHPPIFGFDTVSQCVFCTSGGATCCGGCACNGANILRYPGAGGWAHIFNQGGNSSCGDMGRGGAVCVTWW